MVSCVQLTESMKFSCESEQCPGHSSCVGVDSVLQPNGLWVCIITLSYTLHYEVLLYTVMEGYTQYVYGRVVLVISKDQYIYKVKCVS